MNYLSEQSFDLNINGNALADGEDGGTIPVYIYKVTFKKNLLHIELNSASKDISLQIYTESGHSLTAEKNKLHAKIYVSSGIDDRGCSVSYITSEEELIPLAVDKVLLNKNIMRVLNTLFL